MNISIKPYIYVILVATLVIGVFVPVTSGQETTSTPYYVFKSGTWIEVSPPTSAPPAYGSESTFPYWNGTEWMPIPAPTQGIVWAGTGWGIGNIAPNYMLMVYEGAPEGQVYVWTGTEYALADTQQVQEAEPPLEVPVWDEDRGEWVLGPHQPFPQTNPLCLVGGTPDLVIEEITTNPLPPKLGKTTVLVKVKNIGSAFADPTKTRLITDELNNQIQKLDTPGLDCGESKVIMSNPYGFWDIQQHVFSAWADDNDDIFEGWPSGEMNNNLQALITAVGADLYFTKDDIIMTELDQWDPRNLFMGWNALQFDITLNNQGTDEVFIPPGMFFWAVDLHGQENDPTGKIVNGRTDIADLGKTIPAGGSETITKQIFAPNLAANGNQYSYHAVINLRGISEYDYGNNIVIYIPYKAPDLIPSITKKGQVYGVAWDGAQNVSVDLDYNIEIGGNAKLGKAINDTSSWGCFEYQLDAPGAGQAVTKGSYCIPKGTTLAPGSVITLHAQVGYYTNNPGPRDVKLSIDLKDTVKELDETNNVLATTIMID